MERVYKWMWSRIGKRPWTWIARDTYHQLEYFVLMVSLFSGFFTGYFWALYEIPLLWLTALWGVSTLWFIIGHILWGKKWQEGQGLPPSDKTKP